MKEVNLTPEQKIDLEALRDFMKQRLLDMLMIMLIKKN
jgi:hypothetical protein